MERGAGAVAQGGVASTAAAERGAPIPRSKLISGALLFAAFTVGGILLVARSGRGGVGSLASGVRAAAAGPLWLASALAMLDVCLGGTRIWIIGRSLRPGFRWRAGLRTHLYNTFAAGLTPLQLGGSPAQYFVLRRCGLGRSETFTLLAVNWLGSLGGLVVLGGAALGFLLLTGELGTEGVVARGLLISVAVVAGAAGVLTLLPGWVSRGLLSSRRVRASRFGRRRLLGLGRYRRRVRRFAREGRRAWAMNACVNAAMVAVRCVEGILILAALGATFGGAGRTALVDGLDAAARQAVQFALIYVSPTPAGSGVAEASTVGLLAALVPGGLLVTYTLLWRLYTSYVAIAAGGVQVALDAVWRWGGDASPHP